MEWQTRRSLSYIFLTPILVYAYVGAAWVGLVVAGYNGWSFAFHPDFLFPFEIVGLTVCGFLYKWLRRNETS